MVQLCEVEALLRAAKEGNATALETLQKATAPTTKWPALCDKFGRVKDKNEKNDSDKRVVRAWNELVEMIAKKSEERGAAVRRADV
mmetsp:Transcript_23529/g.75504  ORF Transcript_23529/g.75504 Transcript_23529/m.75504 type:complete len:86 (-) Transcript_23529:1465-1722(-)